VRPREKVDTVTHRMRERLAERRRTERRRAVVKWSKYAAAAAVVLLIVWLVLRSPVFALDPAKVEVSGVSPEVDAAMIDAVLAQYEGESLALLNVPHVADELRDLVGVRDASVERVWPAGLRVTITPRHPVAAIASDDTFVLLDADAVRVGQVDVVPENLPLLDIPLGADNDRILEAVLEVVRNLPQSVLDRVESVGAQTEDTVAFTLRDGPRVEWGSSQDSALKAQVLDVMLSSGAASTADVIDVSAPTLPITRQES
jgi:cell division protein FtsQ